MKKFHALLICVVALVLSACAGLSVPDALAKIDDLNTECHGLVDRLEGQGINTVTGAHCDKAAAEARDKLIELLDQLRAQLAKSGV